MKAKMTKLLSLLVLCLFLLALAEGCSGKKESQPAQNRPAQKRVDQAAEDF